jgi:CRISPR/Cas system CSM-associated protein Csm3 (group 7 of RAMP superfamily)
MTHLRIDLTITTESALSIGAGGSAGTIADKSIVRDGWGRPMIPGSQVKGKLRWAVEQLLRGMGQDIPMPFDPPELIEQANIVRTLFGSPQHRSPLHFADLALALVSDAQAAELRQNLSQVRPSVSINRRRGIAEDARLLFQEITLEGMAFQSERAISGNFGDVGQTEQCAALLWAALKLTDRWGGAKSRGLGWATMQAGVYLDHAQEPVAEAALIAALRVALTPQGGSS